MGVQLTPAEGFALYGLLAETGTDIILKTDRRGFVVHATPALELLGFALPDMLFGPHLAELAAPSHVDALRAEHAAVIAGRRSAQWTEFPARMADGRTAWFELQLRPLSGEQGRVYGALGVMRNVDERRALEERLFAAAMTDPLTGLTNRPAFQAMLGHLVSHSGADASVALFSIDHFKAINLRYGQQTGDTVLTAFADLLRAVLRGQDIISRVGNRRFAVLLPHTAPHEAALLCRRVLATLTDLGGGSGEDGLPVTASAGVARIGGTLDATVRRAELALFLARAKGGNRLEIDEERALPRAA
jgi:diguanylate cyclase (GGDEF)-like protein/PAS domain S-box-containing protein